MSTDDISPRNSTDLSPSTQGDSFLKKLQSLPPEEQPTAILNAPRDLVMEPCVVEYVATHPGVLIMLTKENERGFPFPLPLFLKIAREWGLPSEVLAHLQETVRSYLSLERPLEEDYSFYKRAEVSLAILTHDSAGLTGFDVELAIRELGLTREDQHAALRNPGLTPAAWAWIENYAVISATHSGSSPEGTHWPFPPALESVPKIELANLIIKESKNDPNVGWRMYKRASHHLLSDFDPQIHAVLLESSDRRIRLDLIAQMRSATDSPQTSSPKSRSRS